MLFKINYAIKILLRFTLMISLLSTWKQVHSDELPGIHEYQVKATFLFYFNKFITYPDEAFLSLNADINICILGDDPFQHSLEVVVQNEMIQGHAFKVSYLRDIGRIKECHTLFISQSEQKQLINIINSAKRYPILTVSDIEDFIVRGGMIQFYLRDNKIHFLINPDAVNDAKLRLSSRLLQIAKIVKKE
jgi:hypothetical protein